MVMRVPYVQHIIIHTFSKCYGHSKVKETHKFRFELKINSNVFDLDVLQNCSFLQVLLLFMLLMK
jgi:hypothetical protein